MDGARRKVRWLMPALSLAATGLPTPVPPGRLGWATMPRYAFRVEVQPRYLPEQSAPEQRVWSFAYTITISNAGEVPAQLVSRHWIITNELGEVEEVKGLGV